MPFIVIFSKNQSKMAGVDLVSFPLVHIALFMFSISSLSLHEGCMYSVTAKFPFSFKRIKGPLNDNSAIR